MLVVREELDLGDSARMLLQVRDKFARSDLPDSYFTFHAARADKFTALSQANRCDATLVSIVNLPQKLTIVNSISPDLSIGPSAEDDFIGEDGTEWEDSASPGSILRRACNTSSCDRV